jgi:hypothetical protein
MTDTPGVPASIERSFRDLSDAEVADIETTSLLAGMSWRGSFGWEELLRSQRILIISEAGAGKTYECRTQQERLWRVGDVAFFLDLATLATSSVRDMLSAEEENPRTKRRRSPRAAIIRRTNRSARPHFKESTKFDGSRRRALLW